MPVWTAAMSSWFALTVINGAIGGTALVLAVGGLFAVVWLLGVMILALFLVGGDRAGEPQRQYGAGFSASR